MADSKSASEILEAVVKDGREVLDRASLGLAFRGVAAGLNISFSLWPWGSWAPSLTAWGSPPTWSFP
jgi:hypothetical protein